MCVWVGGWVGGWVYRYDCTGVQLVAGVSDLIEYVYVCVSGPVFRGTIARSRETRRAPPQTTPRPSVASESEVRARLRIVGTELGMGYGRES